MTTMRCLAPITALLILPLAACQIYKPGGNAWFEGPTSAMTFYSTEDSPKTVTLVDIRSGERVFIMEIPAGKQLVLDFVGDNGDDPVNTPDLMKWEVFPIGTGYGALSNAMTVPNRWSRPASSMPSPNLTGRFASMKCRTGRIGGPRKAAPSRNTIRSTATRAEEQPAGTIMPCA